MRKPWFVIGNIPISGTGNSTGSIPLVRARTVSITLRMTWDAAADTDATIHAFYSPDGNNWDTINFATWTITFGVSATAQRTVILDPPEHGYLRIAIANGGQAQALSRVSAWYTIQSWDEVGASTMEHPYKVERKRQTREETGQLVT